MITQSLILVKIIFLSVNCYLKNKFIRERFLFVAADTEYCRFCSKGGAAWWEVSENDRDWQGHPSFRSLELF